MDTVTQLTSQLVKIDSSDPGAYEDTIGDFIGAWLRANAPTAVITKSEVLPGRYNVRAVLTGKVAQPALVYICHMDTVVLGTAWQQSTPLAGEVQGTRLYGRGACDMKSGLACAMTAFATIAQQVAAGRVLQHNLVLIASVDEEDYMRGVEKAIADKWVTAEDLILDGEPTNGQIRMAHKGRTWIKLSTHGVTAHASTPEKGIDAIAAIAELITKLRAEFVTFPTHPTLGRSTITFGTIKGGYRPYVVPDQAEVWIDMRLVPPLNTKHVLTIFEQVITAVKHNYPGLKIDLVIDGDRPPIEAQPQSFLLQNLKATVAEVTQQPAEVGVFTGYTDTAVIAGKLHNLNCMSYGPGDLEMAHKPDEYVELKDIQRCYQVMYRLAERLLLS
ncbi:M20 family metallopeptidase [Loigolactobacillus jiayinensis]|uniref:M20 family metallopeptidase n=1 Tax=Loigolactobacillus jiayinensis TaxID=2486016 RepID=A0ABW1RBK6_9LACO|nr:M20 family metallopeptidase [Loigolactobacillus jiayinensis]